MFGSDKRTSLYRWQNWGDSPGHIFLKPLRSGIWFTSLSMAGRTHFCWKVGLFCCILTSPRLCKKRGEENAFFSFSELGTLCPVYLPVCPIPSWWEWGPGNGRGWGLRLQQEWGHGVDANLSFATWLGKRYVYCPCCPGNHFREKRKQPYQPNLLFLTT